MNANSTFQCFLFAMGFAAFINRGRCEQFIVENGKPRAGIIIAEDPARPAEFGAEELQRYLKKITCARLEIVTAPTDQEAVRIYVGESEHARRAGVTAKGLKRDAFKIVSGENWLALVGKRSYSRSRLGNPEHQPSSDFVKRT